jgi:hypothetical protein
VLPRNVLTVFPPDDPAALFVVAVCAAANDVRDAMVEAGRANPAEHDEPDVTHRRRFTQRLRIAQGHLYEAIVTLKAWRQSSPEVRALLNKLPEEAKRRLANVMGLEQQIGTEALEAVRQNSFHYPYPDPKRSPDSAAHLADAIRKNPDVEAGIDVGEDVRGRYRFADQLMLSMAMGGHDPERHSEQMAMIRDTGIDFANLVDEIFVAYCHDRGIGIDYGADQESDG